MAPWPSTALLLLSITLASAASSSSFPATAACPNPVKQEHGTACVCTGHSCGKFPPSQPPSATEALVVTSSASGGFLQTATVPLAKGSSSSQMDITVDPEVEYQEILGFGGAVTDAVAAVYAELEPGARDELIRQFWGGAAANFSFARVPMNAADFSKMNYALASKPDLSDFCLRDDTVPAGEKPTCGNDYKLAPLRAAVAAHAEAGSALKVFASTWSAAPAFKDQRFACTVKDGMDQCEPDYGIAPAVACNVTVANPSQCNSTNGQGVPCPTVPPTHVTPKATGVTPTTPLANAAGNCFNTGFIASDRMAAWAGHFKKFVDAYQAAGVPIWGVTAQNEPLTQTGLWGSNFYTQQNETEFVTKHLSPTLKAAYPGIKVMVHDDQVTSLADRALAVARAAGEHVDGVAFHWYQALEATFEDGKPEAPLGLPKWLVSNLVNGGADVKTVYDALNGGDGKAADKFLLMTEACSGYSLSTSWVGPRHGEWGYGYATGHDMLWQLRNRAAGWVYWNVILDAKGGPNLAGNYVDSPAYLFNQTAFAQNPSFFFMLHFSRFVPAGSVAVKADVACGASHKEYCQYVAFRTPSGDVVVVMTNDEITVGPIAGTGVGIAATPWLAKGQGSLTLGSKTLSWTVSCKGNVVKGTLPWKAITTVVMPGC